MSSKKAQTAITRRAFNALVFGGAATLALNPGLKAFAQARNGVLTMGMTSPPVSLDPAKNGSGVNEAYLDPVYGCMIHYGFDDGHKPFMAKSYGYVGERNMGFEIQLHEGLVFADGSPLDSAAVKAYLEYYHTAGGPFASSADAIAEIETPDALTVRLHLSEGVPNLLEQFSESGMWGSVPNPKTLANDPDSLGSVPDGAGPYRLDANETVLGAQYVYTPNPDFFDQSVIKWDKIVLKVIDSANGRLQALMARQIECCELDAQTASTAARTGFNVQSTNDTWVGLWLEDREGVVTPAMGDVNFRKAINIAIDRAAIAKALYGEFAEPTMQLTVPSRRGYVPEMDSYYPYDPAKARKLIEEGGYDGTEFTIATASFVPGLVDATQAVSAQLADVGLKMNIETAASFPAFAEMAESAKYPGIFFSWGVGDIFHTLRNHLMPDGVVNPFHSKDDEFIRLIKKLAETDPDKAGDIYHAIVTRMVDLAWFAPVLRTGMIFAWNDRIETPLTGLQYPNPAFYQPKA